MASTTILKHVHFKDGHVGKAKQGPSLWSGDLGRRFWASSCAVWLSSNTGNTFDFEEAGFDRQEPRGLESGCPDWKSISYPAVYNIEGGKEMIYYRVLGHVGYWTYSVTEDGGKPERLKRLKDMDVAGRFEWSSYQTKLLSQDGKTLHVAFIVYDDCKFEDPDRAMSDRLQSLYREKTGQDWKYNLYYFQIDLASTS